LVKGEVKERYFNPFDMFQEIQVISLAPWDIDPRIVSKVFGRARAILHIVGPKSLFSKIIWRLVPEIYYLVILKKVLNKVASIRPSVIRAYNASLQGFLSVYIGKKLRIPTVISLHSCPDYDAKFIAPRRIIFWGRRSPVKALFDFYSLMKFQTIGRLFEWYCLKSASEVICAYRLPMEIARKYGRTDAHLIYNRVDPNRFKPADKPVGVVPITILHVGVLTYEKNPENLIRATVNLPVRLIVVGDGELRDYLQRIVNNLNIADKVQFIYRVENQSIHRLYNEADIFVMCLKVGGVSIPILEAMASGLPIVYTKCIYEKKKELIGDVGIEVLDDPKHIERVLMFLIQKPELRQQMGLRGRELFLKISGEKMEEMESMIYRKLLNIEK
jgi:glycosyltransferase involved in cell wall biosynthesis